MTPLELLADLVAIPGPPGQEGEVVRWLADRVTRPSQVDAKGNLIVALGKGAPKVVVTAHCDEIALMVQRIEPDGPLTVVPLGGIHPWKIGEGPMLVLGSERNVDGVLSFGSIHTEDPGSTVRRMDREPLTWPLARVVTMLTPKELQDAGVRPGSRVVVHPSRRGLLMMGSHVAGFFLDDRADLVSWLLALEQLADAELPVVFAATVSEEVGAEGALFLLRDLRPEVCIALELGPNVPDAPVQITSTPTVWAKDSYASMSAADLNLITRLAPNVQVQVLSRGGSDASLAVSHGLVARPITLGLPVENSHGFEIIHADSMHALADLTVKLVRALCETG